MGNQVAFVIHAAKSTAFATEHADLDDVVQCAAGSLQNLWQL